LNISRGRSSVKLTVSADSFNSPDSLLHIQSQIDNTQSECDIKKLKFKLLNHVTLREKPARTVNQHVQDQQFTSTELMLKVKTGIVKAGALENREVAITLRDLMQSCVRMQNEGYLKGKVDIQDEDQKRLLDFLPPSVESNLISISFVLQVFLTYKGLTLPNMKPKEEIPITVQCFVPRP
jgi:hypothetical protein